MGIISSLGDRVWNDRNQNGLQDSGEEGIAGATVELLLDKAGSFELLATRTTDAQGLYQFSGLTAGTNYRVRFMLPSGFEAVSPRQADGSSNSGKNSDAYLSDIVVLAPGEHNSTIDAGFYELCYGEIGDYVWHDANANGRQDGDESGLPEIVVKLYSATTGALLTETLTDDSGWYAFTDLAAGNYKVQFEAPRSYTFSAKDVGSDDLDSDADSMGMTGVIKLADGQHIDTVDAGLYSRTTLVPLLGDKVWHDKNANGVQEDNEEGIANVKVELYNATNQQVATTTTNAEGIYHFTDLLPGDYKVRFVKPDAYIFTDSNKGGNDEKDSDADNTGYTGSYTLNSGETNLTVDAGLYLPTAIGDYVWVDSNANGIQDANEKGLAEIKVHLHDGAGNFIAEKMTTADGAYKFTDLRPGDYKVQFMVPNGYAFTKLDAGNDDAKDSDAGAQGWTKVYTLESGKPDLTVDAGIYKLASIGDFVWHDKNANGIQESGEYGMKGVTVELYDTDTGKLLDTEVTAADGKYRFDNLFAGNYKVRFVTNDYIFSEKDVGVDDKIDSDADDKGYTGSYALVLGQYNNTVDAGLYKLAAIGDKVWFDDDADGIQDASEKGVADITVGLYDGDGKFVRDTTTNALGEYAFGGLKPGSYKVKFALPAHHAFTTKDAGSNDAVDSDAAADGYTIAYQLESGIYNDTVDAGIYKLASIGDTVWHDKNANGIQEQGEEGIKGVAVHLFDAAGKPLGEKITDADGKYRFDDLAAGTYKVHFEKNDYNEYTTKDAGTNDAIDSDADEHGSTRNYTLALGQYDDSVDAGLFKYAAIGDKVWMDKNVNGLQDADEPGVAEIKVALYDVKGDLVADQVTGISGEYKFDKLRPGNYKVQFVIPKNYVFTTQDVGSDDTIDSDANAEGKTTWYTLQSGEYNKTADAGIYALSSIGDRVWHDENANGIQDAAEKGISGVKVHLYDVATGKLLGEKTTDSKGEYRFEGLYAGKYKVHFESAGYQYTKQNAGSDDKIDSDADTTGMSDVIDLPLGLYNNTVDAGLYQYASLGDKVWIDQNENGVQDANEVGLKNVTVTLFDNAGNSLTQTATNDQGEYLFDKLVPGEYKVKFAKPTNYEFTKQDIGGNTESADKVDSDVDAGGWTGVYTLKSGEVNTTADAGVYLNKAAVGDRVWLDSNANGKQDAGEKGIADIAVKLYNAAGTAVAETKTNSDGLYKFDNLVPGKYKVWFDAPTGYQRSDANIGADDADSDAGNDGFTAEYDLLPGTYTDTVDAGLYKLAAIGDKVWHDLNANGVQNANEAGLADVKVHLHGPNGLHLSTTTNAAGEYGFTNLKPGAYTVKFDKLTDYYFSPQNNGDDEADSDADRSSGETGEYILTSGQVNNSVDAGMYKLAAIGDKVWLDYKHNSIQDASEPGLAGATIELRNSGGVVATTTTDAKGEYHFTGVTPGTYWLEATYVFGYGFVPRDVGNDDTIDSDANYNGKTIKTELTSGEVDNTWDFGLTPLVLDLNGDGIQTVSRANSAGKFDLFGNGNAIDSGWISSQDGFLAIDNNGNGRIDDISELFGGTKQGDGFAKLASYDSNQDGVVNANDADFANLLVWQDLNGNHQTDADELRTLNDAGISTLNAGYVALPALDSNGNLHLERSSAVLADGTVIDMTDVYFNVAAVDATQAGVELPTMAELLAGNESLDGLLGATAPIAMQTAADIDTSVFAGLSKLAQLYDQHNYI